MRAAPPVNLQCAGGVVWRALQATLASLAAGVLVWWALALMSPPLAPTPIAVLAAAVAAASGAVAGWRAGLQRPVQLGWDGQRWTADGTRGSLDLMIDLGGWLLLRLRPGAPGKARWIAVSAREAGPALHALRTAVHARPPRDARACAVAGRTAERATERAAQQTPD